MNHSISPGHCPSLQLYLSQLDNQVLILKVNHTWSLSYYYHKLNELINQSLQYEHDNNIQLAYINYRRTASLFLYTIAEHKLFNTAQLNDKTKYTNLVRECMARMNLLRGKLVESFDRKQIQNLQQQQQHKHIQQSTEPLLQQPVSSSNQSTDTQSIPPSSIASAVLDSSLLSRLAALGVDTNDTNDNNNKSSQPIDSIPASNQLDDSSINRLNKLGITPLTDNTTPAHKRIDSETDARLQALGIAAADSLHCTPADQSSRLSALGITPETSNNNTATGSYIPPPPPPPPTDEQSPTFTYDNTPFDDNKLSAYPSLDNHISTTRSTDQHHTHSTQQLRQLHVPHNLLSEFDRLASSNTSRDIETCGILCGKLSLNQLYITHCIIPSQHGTSNQCMTMNEEDVFNIQIQYDLITLGWIHTHPTQTAFLSSIDLHTQYGYQIMMNESIAIVLAPCSTPNYGIYHINQNGMSIIGECNLGSTFHTHDNMKLFDDVQHIVWDQHTQCQVIDMR